jgi:3-methyladenine DNA glycosylase/8-oxoguanine DNA glycosylase
LDTPVPFDLDLTVRSHGFYDLPPWTYDPQRRVLARPLLLATGRTARVEVAQRRAPAADGAAAAAAGLALRVLADGRLAAAEAREARAQVRTCLALDEDLAPFYRLVDALEAKPAGRAPLPPLRWAIARGAGRLLRSPTVFEDAVKTLCTTNCTWALTRSMVANLVAALGAPAPLGERAFPTPQAMAAQREPFYRDVIRAGYRAPFLASLAREVASGALDVEAWRDPGLPTDELARRIEALPGFGPYATEHLLRLLGRYDHLALDSWVRGKLARLRGKRRVPADGSIRRWYAPYGRYAGLAMWLEVTADWHDRSRPEGA